MLYCMYVCMYVCMDVNVESCSSEFGHHGLQAWDGLGLWVDLGCSCPDSGPPISIKQYS